MPGQDAQRAIGAHLRAACGDSLGEASTCQRPSAVFAIAVQAKLRSNEQVVTGYRDQLGRQGGYRAQRKTGIAPG